MPTITLGAVIEVYADLAQANTYFLSAVHGAAWAAVDGNTRQRALVTATSMLERSGWRGAPTEPIDKALSPAPSTQPLQWPRTGLTDRNGVAVDSASIPADVVNGNMELALALINDATAQTTTSTGSNVKSVATKDKVDVVETSVATEFFSSTSKNATRFPTIVHELLGRYLAASTTSVGIFAPGTGILSGAGVDWGTC